MLYKNVHIGCHGTFILNISLLVLFNLFLNYANLEMFCIYIVTLIYIKDICISYLECEVKVINLTHL